MQFVLQEVQAQFDKHVNIRDLSCHVLEVDEDAIKSIYNYWILKRKSRSNRPLIPSRREDVDVLATNKQEEEDVEKRKMFVHLRQDLERVRNLCYMVNRREKLSRSYFKTKEQIFLKQVVVLEAIVNSSNVSESSKTTQEELITAVMNANRGPAQYDKFYTSDQSEKKFLTYADIDNKILGGQKSASNSKNAGKSSNRGRNKKVNGASVSSAPKKPSVFMDSLSESDSDSESSVGAVTSAVSTKKPKTSKESYSRRKKNQKSLETLSTTTSTSSDEDKSTKKRPYKNDGLSRIEKEFEREKARKICNDEISSNDSDDLIQIADNKKSSNRKSMVPIYSDTDSDSNAEDTKKNRHQSMRDSSKMDVDGDGDNSHSQSQKFRTKGAKKEFSLQQPKKVAKTAPTDGSSGISSLGGGTTSGCETNSTPKSTKISPKTKPKDSKKDSTDISKFATELLVPQRQAAKKASENMRAPPTTDLPFVPQRQAAKKASENMKAKEAKEATLPVKEKDKEEDKRSEKEKDDKDKEKPKLLDVKSKGRGRPSKNSTSINRNKSKESERDLKESKKEDKDELKSKSADKEKSKNKESKSAAHKRKEKEEEKERKKDEERRRLEEDLKKEEERKKEEEKRQEAERLKEEEKKMEELLIKEEEKRKVEEEVRKEEKRKAEEGKRKEEKRKAEEEKERKREEERVRKREEERIREEERKREEELLKKEEEKEKKREEERKREEEKERKREEEKERKREEERERKREEDKERKRLEAEKERKRVEVEKERKRIEVDKQRKREEEKKRKKEAEEKQKIKEAEELEQKRNDHTRKKDEEKRSKSSKSSSSTSISYVPQRQAAKKAAEHIKSGLVPKPPTAEQLAAEDKEKEIKTPEKKKAPVRRQSLLKESPNKKVVAPPPPPPPRSPTPQKSINLSSSSSESSDSESSTSSSGSGSSSDSDSEDETNEPGPQKSTKSKEISPKKSVSEVAVSDDVKASSHSHNKKAIVDKHPREVSLKSNSQENSSSSTSCSNTNSSSCSPQLKPDEDEEEPSIPVLDEDSEDPQKLSNEIIEELKMEEEKLLMNYHNPIANESPQLEDNNTPYTPASCELVINSASPIKSISSSTTTISPPSPSPLPPSSIPPPTPCGAVMNKNCVDIIELDSNSDESVKLIKSSTHRDKNIILPSENSIDFDSKLNSMGDLSSDCIGLGSKDELSELDKPPPTPMVLEYSSSEIKSNQKDATVPSLPQLDQATLNQSLSTYLWNDFSNAPLFLSDNVVTKEDEIKETNKLLEKLRQRRGQKAEDLQAPSTPNSNNPDSESEKKMENEELLPEKTTIVPEQSAHQNEFFKDKNDFSDVNSAKENINTNVNVTLNSSRKNLVNDCDYDDNTRGIQSPYNVNMWNENDLIPKRRSVSTSPSSVSESNEEFRMQQHQKKIVNEQKEDQKQVSSAPTQAGDISSQLQASNIFNNFFEGVAGFQAPQQPSIPSPNVSQNILLNGAPNAASDMVSAYFILFCFLKNAIVRSLLSVCPIFNRFSLLHLARIVGNSR